MMKLSSTTFELQSNALRLLLTMRRVGMVGWIGLTMAMLGAGYFTIGLAWEEQSNDQLMDSINQWNRQHQDYKGKAIDTHQSQAQLFHAFTQNLGNPDDLENYVKTLFALAQVHDVALPDGEYKIGGYVQEGFLTYEVALPIKGTYPSIQAFCEDVLLTLPYVALDSIQFHRESVALEEVEAKVRLTMYLRSPKNTASLLQFEKRPLDNNEKQGTHEQFNPSNQTPVISLVEKGER
ncbi:hypothetical protein AAKU58_004130 [Oxalobacteraceae bacterium GrIS 1.18]